MLQAQLNAATSKIADLEAMIEHRYEAHLISAIRPDTHPIDQQAYKACRSGTRFSSLFSRRCLRYWISPGNTRRLLE